MRKFRTSISLGLNKIENLAPGEIGTDAVNLNQLNNAIGNVGGSIWQLDNDSSNIFYLDGKVGINRDAAYMTTPEAKELNILGGISIRNANDSIVIGEGANASGIGRSSVFIGYYAGANVSGAFLVNTMIGAGAGFKTTTGNSNFFIGFSAGYNNESGSSNFAIGNSAGASNVSGNYNVNIGNSAGMTNTGSKNTYIGAIAGQHSAHATDNVFIGHNSGTFSQESRNVGIGIEVGYNLATPSHENVLIGHYAARSLDGSNNQLIGFQAGYDLTGNWNVGIGHKVAYEANVSENIMLGTEAGYFAQGNFTLILGYKAGQNAQGSDNILIGREVGQHINGSKNYHIGTKIGSDTTQNLINTIAIGDEVTIDFNNQIVIGDEKMVELKTGRIRFDVATTPQGGMVPAWNGVKYIPTDVNDLVDFPDPPDPVSTFWEQASGSPADIINNNAGRVIIDNIRLDGNVIETNTNYLEGRFQKLNLGDTTQTANLSWNGALLNIIGGTLDNDLLKASSLNRTGYLYARQVTNDTIDFHIYQNDNRLFLASAANTVGIKTGAPLRDMDIDGSLRVTDLIYDSSNQEPQHGQILSPDPSGVQLLWQDINDFIDTGSTSLWTQHPSHDTVYTLEKVAVGQSSDPNLLGGSKMAINGALSLVGDFAVEPAGLNFFRGNTYDASIHFFHNLIGDGSKNLILSAPQSNSGISFQVNTSEPGDVTALQIRPDRRIVIPNLTGSDGTPQNILWTNSEGVIHQTPHAETTNAYAFKVQSFGQTITAGGLLPFEFQSTHIENGHLNNVAHTITLPVSGVYCITVRFRTDLDIDENFSISIRNNGNGLNLDSVTIPKKTNQPSEYMQAEFLIIGSAFTDIVVNLGHTSVNDAFINQAYLHGYLVQKT